MSEMSARRYAIPIGALLLGLGVALSACLGSADDDTALPGPQDLLNREFLSTSVIEDGRTRPLVDDTELRLSFESESGNEFLSWHAGCNQFSGEGEITVDELRVGRFGGTLMGCAHDLAVQETRLTQFLQGDPTWQLSGAALTLTSGEVVIRFTTKPEATAKRIEPVRRSPRGRGREPPSDREVALARQIMAANAFLRRIVDDGGWFRIVQTGIVKTAGPDRILGLIVDIRLNQAVDAIYELPLVCHGVAGPPFALPATPFNLDDVSRLLVTVTFADRRVAAIDPRNGTARPEPGAAYLSVPSTCERRATRDVGY